MYAMTGDPQHMTKHSVEPYLGSFGKDVKQKHRAELVGRVHRWARVTTDISDWIFIVCLDKLLYIRMGFPLLDIRKLWHSVCLPEFAAGVVPICLKLVSLTCRSLVVPTHTQLDTLHVHCDLAQSIAQKGESPPIVSTMGKGGFGKGRDNWGSSSWQAPAPAWQPQNAGGWGKGSGWQGSNNASPMSNIANNLSSMLGEIHAVGEMSRLGAVLNQQQQQQWQPPVPVAYQQQPVTIPGMQQQPVTGSPVASTAPAEHLMTSLTQVLQQAVKPPGTQAEDTVQQQKIKHTINTSSALAGNASGNTEFVLDEAPAFKKLKSQMEELRTTVAEHSDHIRGMQRTCTETASDVKQILGCLSGQSAAASQSPSPFSQSHSSPPPRVNLIAPDSQPPPGRTPGHMLGGSHTPRNASGVPLGHSADPSGTVPPNPFAAHPPNPFAAHPPGGSTATEATPRRLDFHEAAQAEREPLFTEEIDIETHKKACAHLGISSTRQAAVELEKELDENSGAPWEDYWAKLSKLKSVEQWRSKLKTLGAKEDQVQQFGSLKDIGTFFYTNMNANCHICDTAIQLAPAS